MVTPLTVTPAWLRIFADSRQAGSGYTEAAQRATECCGISGKEFARCRISTGTLSVPVAGSASVLKKRVAEPLLSEHGKWRREHLGAWNAAYGRAPFFIHLMPEIEMVYLSSEGKTLEEFNREMLAVALSWIDFDAIHKDSSRLREVGLEIFELVDPSLSVFDALFRLGPDTVFAFCAR